MNEVKHISEVLLQIASDPQDDWGKVLRQCPFIQRALLEKGIISLDDLTDDECDRLVDQTFLEDWIDGQEVMQKLHVSQRTLQTLRSNGTIPFTKVGHKIWYSKKELEHILRCNHVMFNIREHYGEDF